MKKLSLLLGFTLLFSGLLNALAGSSSFLSRLALSRAPVTGVPAFLPFIPHSDREPLQHMIAPAILGLLAVLLLAAWIFGGSAGRLSTTPYLRRRYHRYGPDP